MTDFEGLPEAFWTDDRLDRMQQAERLTRYLLSVYETQQEKSPNVGRHFVLNIDSEWGYGKTFFIDRWMASLKELGHPVMKYDAWKNDYTKDPLSSLLTTLIKQLTEIVETGEQGKTGFDLANAKKFAKQVIKVVAPIGIGAIAAVATDVFFSYQGGIYTNGNADEEATDFMKDVTSAGVNELFKDQEAREASIELFKQEISRCLGTLSKDKNKTLPMFIFIDELDRCRPPFSVDLIEVVKHILCIDDIYFVFATAGNQLNASIKKMYGSEFSGEMYVKRFFNKEVKLSRPNNTNFAKMLIDKHGTPHFENLLIQVYRNEKPIQARRLADIFSMVASYYRLSLRDQEQCFSAFDMFIRTFPQGKKIHVIYLLYLIVLQHLKKHEFHKHVDGLISLEKIDQMINKAPGYEIETIQRGVNNKQRKLTISQIGEFYNEYSLRPFNEIKEPMDSTELELDIYEDIKREFIGAKQKMAGPMFASTRLYLDIISLNSDVSDSEEK